MTTLRYDEAADAAVADELRGGRQVIVLRLADVPAPGTAMSNGAGDPAETGGDPGSGADSDASGSGGGARPASGLALVAPARVRSTPARVGAASIVATALGAALSGLRPLVVLSPPDEDRAGWSLASLASELVATSRPQAAAASGGGDRSATAPGAVTLRVLAGGRKRPAGARSNAAAAELAALLSVPDLTVAAPATAQDAYGLTRSAVEHPGHVVLLESAELGPSTGELPAGSGAVPLGRADTVRHGDRITVVAARRMRQVALAAADILARDGIEAEVIDPRTLVPLDLDGVAASLARTSRLLVVQDDALAAVWAQALVAGLTAGHFDLFDAPPRIVGISGAAHEAGAPAISPEEVAAAGSELAAY